MINKPSFQNKDFSILFFSTTQESLEMIELLKKHNFNVIPIFNICEFDKIYNELNIGITVIEIPSKILSQEHQEKFNSLTSSPNVITLLNDINMKCYLNQTSNYLIKPFNHELLLNKIVGFQKLIFHRWLNYIKNMNRKEIEIEFLYQLEDNKSYMSLFKQEYTNSVEQYFKTVDINNLFITNKKLIKLELISELIESIYKYTISLVSMNIVQRKEYLRVFTLQLIYRYYCVVPEKEILRPLIHNLLNMLKQTLPHRFMFLLEVIYELEFKYINLLFDEITIKNENEKVSSIMEKTIHFFMSSSSDVLGNLVNNLDNKDFLFNKLKAFNQEALSNNMSNTPKIKKILNALDDAGNPLEELSEFLQQQSKLFRTFKSHVNIELCPKEFIFMLEFVFINGMKIQYPNIDISLVDSLDKDIKFEMNEYVMANAIYSILENAIEADCKVIEIYLKNDTHAIYMDIKNNGKEIKPEIVDFMFDKNFSYDKENRAGIGLSASKKWLESIYCELEYVNKDKAMRITIPYSCEILN